MNDDLSDAHRAEIDSYKRRIDALEMQLRDAQFTGMAIHAMLTNAIEAVDHILRVQEKRP